MKKYSWVVLLVALLFGLSLATMWACAQSGGPLAANDPSGPGGGGRGDDDDDDDASPTTVTAAFVYATGDTDSADWKALLVKGGFTVTVIAESSMPTADLTGYDVLISDFNVFWLDQNAVLNIKNSGIPVLAMYGSVRLFDYLSLPIGWQNGSWETATQVRVVDPTHAVFKKPTNLNFSQDQLFTISSTTFDTYYQDVTPAPTGVVALANRVNQTGWGIVFLENSKYLYWGLDPEPSTFTSGGAQFFLNCVNYLASQR